MMGFGRKTNVPKDPEDRQPLHFWPWASVDWAHISCGIQKKLFVQFSKNCLAQLTNMKLLQHLDVFKQVTMIDQKLFLVFK